MYRKIIAFIVCLAFSMSFSLGITYAGEKKDAGLSAWLKSLQNKISQIMPKKSLEMSTGVAGVRGTKQDAHTKLYWKGKKGKESVTEEELKSFQSAVDLALKGDTKASAKELDNFMKQYPDSALIPDAKKTLDLVTAAAK